MDPISPKKDTQGKIGKYTMQTKSKLIDSEYFMNISRGGFSNNLYISLAKMFTCSPRISLRRFFLDF